MRQKLCALAVVSLLVSDATAPAQPVTCAMDEFTRHVDPNRTRIYAAGAGVASIYFRANVDVNSDGAARSYHPADPRGRTLALNNVGNAITRMFDANGRNITCAPRTGACFERYITTFEAARDSGYNPNGFPRIETTGIIPWRTDPALGRKVPCTISAGPFAGFFVSQTSLSVDPRKDVCDQSRYLDSLSYAAIVLPGRVEWRSQGVTTDDGDLVAVRNVATGTVTFAINGDRGPQRAIGEGTLALAAALNGRTLTGKETFAELKRLVVRDAQYVIFPRDDIRRIAGSAFTQKDIDTAGARVFQQWGGTARLDSCSSLAR
jgi:hypothetical protein